MGNRSLYISLIIFIDAIAFLFWYNNASPTRDDLALMGGIGLLQLIFSIVSWKKCGRDLISPYIFFLGSLYVFSFGQSLMYPFGLASMKRDLVGMFGITVLDVYDAQFMTIVMLGAFQIGGLLSLNKFTLVKSKYNNGAIETERLKKIGKFLFGVSVIPYFYFVISDAIISMTSGYQSIFAGEGERVGLANLWHIIGDYFIPSLICLYIAYRNEPSNREKVSVIMLVCAFLILLIGGRSEAVIMLSLLLILRHLLVKQFSKKYMLIGLASAFVFLQLLAFIAETRDSSNRSMSIEFKSNGAVETVAEMGWSQFCLIKSMDQVPQKEDFRYGKSYAYSFLTLIPNLGFWKIHPAKKEANLGDHLGEELGMTFGIGFSMCAEAWFNFGYFGFLIFILWGYFLGKLFGRVQKYITFGNVAGLAFLFVFYWFSLKLPRNSFIGLVRAIFYYSLPVYLYCRHYKLKYSRFKS